MRIFSQRLRKSHIPYREKRLAHRGTGQGKLQFMPIVLQWSLLGTGPVREKRGNSAVGDLHLTPVIVW
jgi:hypothetical protein